MPRIARSAHGGVIYHVHNHIAPSEAGFADESDFLDFTKFMAATSERTDMRILAGCLLPDHFHLLLWPHEDGDLSRWMTGLMTRHVRRYRKKYGGEGRVWPRRFKAFPVEPGSALLDVIHFIESHPARSGLVRKASDWPWGSFEIRRQGNPHGFLAEAPHPIPANWPDQVLGEMEPDALKQLRYCSQRGAPYGSAEWVNQMVSDLSLETTMRPHGRPRKIAAD